MAAEMDDLKRLIRSILTSSPLEMQIFKLDKDYEEINGERIRFRAFGFNSLEDLLRSIPDTVQVYGNGPRAVLKVIASSKSKHIDELVSKQRGPDRRRSRNRPRPPRRTAALRSGGYQQRPPMMQYPTYPIPYNMRYNPPHYMQSSRQNLPPGGGLLPTPVYNNAYNAQPEIPPRFNRTVEPHRPIVPVVASTPGPSTSKVPLLPNSANMSPIEQKSTIKDSWKSLMNEQSGNGTIPKQKPELSPQISPISETESPIARCSWKDIINEQNSSGVVFNQANDLSPQLTPMKSDGGSCYLSDQEGFLSDGEFLPEDEYINYNVPFHIQENLKTLIGQCKEGVWCAEVPNVYLKMFKKRLDYSTYGYKSLIQMCMALEKIFHCHRPDNGDFLLFDKTKPIPTDILKNLQYVAAVKAKLELKPPELPTEPALIDTEDLLRETAVDSYPLGVMQLGDEIPRQFIPDDVTENGFIDVIVGEVYDPSKFWILLKAHSQDLDSLMDEMQTFYTGHEGGNLEIPQHMVQVGLYCAAKYNNEYHRAVIVRRAFEQTRIKVFYADYGTLATINEKDLLFLHRRFMNFPLQAIRARLASIWPPVELSPWSLKASSRLLSLVQCKNLVAHIFRINRPKQTLEIFLADTSTDEDIYMNDTLVNEGLALFTNKEQQPKTLHPRRIPKYKYMHLYPTFEDLEEGNALSAAEVVRLGRTGFSEEYLYPNHYIAVITEETILNDAEFIESHRKLLNETERLNNPSSNYEPTPDWTKELSKEEDDVVNIEQCGAEASISSLSEDASITPESPVSPGHQVFATPTLKPPPGFKCIEPNRAFGTNTGLMSNPSGQSQSLIATVLPPPILMTNHPVNFVTQQVIDPALFLQNSQQNELLQQLALSRMLGYQLSLPNNAWNTQQQLQNLLINQQKQLLIAQQQNSLLFPPQNSGLFSTQWNNPNFFANQPSLNCLGTEQRQQLQSYIHRHLINGNRNLLIHLGNMLSSQNDKKQGLFKIICQILLSQTTTTSLYQELQMIITDLLNLLADSQIIDLATKLLGSTEQQSNYTPTPTVSSNNSVEDMLAKLMSQTSINPQSTSSSESVKKDNAEVQTDPELGYSSKIQNNKKLVIQTVLKNQPIHVIRFKDQLYVPLKDIFQFTTTECSVDVIRKLVVMADNTCSIINIRLSDYKELAKELAKYKIVDSTVHVVSVAFIPNMTQILGSKENLLTSYSDFLKSISIDSDLWLMS